MEGTFQSSEELSIPIKYYVELCLLVKKEVKILDLNLFNNKNTQSLENF